MIEDPDPKGRVAELPPIIRAYISHCWNCKNCVYDCGSINYIYRKSEENNLRIRGPCALFDYLEVNLNEQPKNHR